MSIIQSLNYTYTLDPHYHPDSRIRSRVRIGRLLSVGLKGKIQIGASISSDLVPMSMGDVSLRNSTSSPDVRGAMTSQINHKIGNWFSTQFRLDWDKFGEALSEDDNTRRREKLGRSINVSRSISINLNEVQISIGIPTARNIPIDVVIDLSSIAQQLFDLSSIRWEYSDLNGTHTAFLVNVNVKLTVTYEIYPNYTRIGYRFFAQLLRRLNIVIEAVDISLTIWSSFSEILSDVRRQGRLNGSCHAFSAGFLNYLYFSNSPRHWQGRGDRNFRRGVQTAERIINQDNYDITRLILEIDSITNINHTRIVRIDERTGDEHMVNLGAMRQAIHNYGEYLYRRNTH